MATPVTGCHQAMAMIGPHRRATAGIRSPWASSSTEAGPLLDERDHAGSGPRRSACGRADRANVGVVERASRRTHLRDPLRLHSTGAQAGRSRRGNPDHNATNDANPAMHESLILPCPVRRLQNRAKQPGCRGRATGSAYPPAPPCAARRYAFPGPPYIVHSGQRPGKPPGVTWARGRIITAAGDQTY
jgi:hypothetical protein